jgi:dimeric dUTPase (all-alpha-NTP-PPase superfamily)
VFRIFLQQKMVITVNILTPINFSKKNISNNFCITFFSISNNFESISNNILYSDFSQFFGLQNELTKLDNLEKSYGQKSKIEVKIEVITPVTLD